MDLNELEKAAKEAMQAAKEAPGKYGGRYIGRFWDSELKKEFWIVLRDDDPSINYGDFDIVAQAMPGKIHGMGHARYWFNDDGSINREYFSGYRDGVKSVTSHPGNKNPKSSENGRKGGRPKKKSPDLAPPEKP